MSDQRFFDQCCRCGCLKEVYRVPYQPPPNRPGHDLPALQYQLWCCACADLFKILVGPPLDIRKE